MAEETSASLGDETRRAALVIAVSTYSDPMLRQLRAPAEDAAEFGAVLGDPQLGDFSVTTVTDGRAHEIRIAVEEFLAEQRPGDLSLVYLSCHGLMDARRRLYFAATDTLKNRLAATGIEARWLLDQLEECRARRQVVILDCCFSGAFAAGSKGEGDLELGDRFLGQGRGRVVLTASRGTEYSFEGSPTPQSAIPGSVFTSALAAGIRTGAADRDGDGWVTVDDAYVYAFDEMRAAGAQQTPQRWLYGAEGGIVLARNPTAAAESGPPPTTAPPASPPSGGHDDQAERDHVRGTVPPVRATGFDARTRWRRLAAVAGALVIAALAGIAVYTVVSRGPEFSFTNGVVEATGPWRMQLFNRDDSTGCTVTLTDLDGGNTSTVPSHPAYGHSTWQMQATGRFRLETSKADCEVSAENGAGDRNLPLKVLRGDSESFNPSGDFTVRGDEFGGQYPPTSCEVVLRDGETGTIVDSQSVTPQSPTQRMHPGSRSSVYLSDVPCPVTVIDD